MTNEITVQPEQQINNTLTQHLSTDQFNMRRQQIVEIMQKNMTDKVDYGTIPGCGHKKVLFKPGAEKLCSIFALNPKFDIKVDDFENNHKNYNITCNIYNMQGGFLGSGLGSCSTMESKYRKRGEPADHYNTVLKVAKKRALVDAILTVTACSDLYTQDLEDIEENIIASTFNPQEAEQFLMSLLISNSEKIQTDCGLEELNNTILADHLLKMFKGNITQKHYDAAKADPDRFIKGYINFVNTGSAK